MKRKKKLLTKTRHHNRLALKNNKLFHAVVALSQNRKSLNVAKINGEKNRKLPFHI